VIYNLREYIKINLPELSVVLNGWDKTSPEESITIMQRGGSPDHDNLKQEIAVQVLSRSVDVNTALKNIESVYNLLKNRFGLVLPEVTVGDTVFPEVKTYQISPVQNPGYLGSDRSNLEMWSFNLIVTTV